MKPAWEEAHNLWYPDIRVHVFSTIVSRNVKTGNTLKKALEVIPVKAYKGRVRVPKRMTFWKGSKRRHAACYKQFLLGFEEPEKSANAENSEISR